MSEFSNVLDTNTQSHTQKNYTMNNQEVTNGITRTFQPITVDEVKPHTYKADKGIHSAQIRQIVETTYPAARVNNSLNEGLFNTEDFNLTGGQTYQSTRVTWLDVPAGTTAEQVQTLLEAKPEARIYRIISNNVEDVMSAEQKQAVSVGLRTLEEFQEQLRVRYVDPTTSELIAVEPAQYRNYGFSQSSKADIDYRTTERVELEGKTQTQAETTNAPVKTEAPVNTAAEGVVL